MAELKMVRLLMGVSRIGWIRNECIIGTAQVEGFEVRKVRLRWSGQGQRRHSGYIGQRILNMQLPGRRKTGIDCC